MKIYWTTRSIPELAEVPAGERELVRRTTFWRAFRHWQTWLALFSYYASVFVGISLGAHWGQGRLLPFLLIAGAVTGIGWLVFAQVVIGYMRPYIRSYLQRSGPVAPTADGER